MIVVDTLSSSCFVCSLPVSPDDSLDERAGSSGAVNASSAARMSTAATSHATLNGFSVVTNPLGNSAASPVSVSLKAGAAYASPAGSVDWQGAFRFVCGRVADRVCLECGDEASHSGWERTSARWVLLVERLHRRAQC